MSIYFQNSGFTLSYANATVPPESTIYHEVEVGVNEAMFVQLTIVESLDAIINQSIDNVINNNNINRVVNVSFLVVKRNMPKRMTTYRRVNYLHQLIQIHTITTVSMEHMELQQITTSCCKFGTSGPASSVRRVSTG
jgi:hypothetical protein